MPSDPAVLKVPWIGWTEMALTEKTFVMFPEGGSRWHLNEKLRLYIMSAWLVGKDHLTPYLASLSSTYWKAHLPSILPTANPVASLKQLTTLVCHLRGLWRVL